MPLVIASIQLAGDQFSGLASIESRTSWLALYRDRATCTMLIGPAFLRAVMGDLSERCRVPYRAARVACPLPNVIQLAAETEELDPARQVPRSA